MFARAIVDPAETDSLRFLRGLHIPVATDIGTIANGIRTIKILQADPDLERDDNREAFVTVTETTSRPKS